MRDVRINFSKLGRLRFISHLDLNRAMLRALRRTDIPIWYTEGFNPHPYAAFALPLPLGAESENDVLDIRVVGDIKNAAVMDKLNAVLPDGLTVTDCHNPIDKFSEITAADYLFFFEKDADRAMLQKVLESGTLLCEKNGKSHGRKVVKTVNLLEHLPAFSFTEREEDLLLHLTLPAGSKNNVNPILLSQALQNQCHTQPFLIRRVQLLTDHGILK